MVQLGMLKMITLPYNYVHDGHNWKLCGLEWMRLNYYAHKNYV